LFSFPRIKRRAPNKRSVTPNLEDRQQNEYRRVLEDLLRLDENKLCADCKKTGPKWASVTLGIFLCLDCAGLHRNLGVHISFIRSTSLDTWKAEQIEAMKNMGNRKSNEIFEANLSSDFPKPNPGDKMALGNWIRTKYVDKSFARKNEAGRSQRNPNQGNASQPITRRENENFSVKKKGNRRI
jgi:stromal membrane-associated protein